MFDRTLRCNHQPKNSLPRICMIFHGNFDMSTEVLKVAKHWNNTCILTLYCIWMWIVFFSEYGCELLCSLVRCWKFFGYIIYVWPLAAIRIPIFHETFKEICTRTWCLINQRCSALITILYLHMQVNRRGIFWQPVGVSSSVQKGC